MSGGTCLPVYVFTCLLELLPARLQFHSHQNHVRAIAVREHEIVVESTLGLKPNLLERAHNFGLIRGDLRDQQGESLLACELHQHADDLHAQPALAKILAREPVTTEEYLSLDDFRLWCTFLDWSELKTKRDRRISRLGSLSDRLVNRGKPYRVIEIDVHHDEGQSDQRKAIELQTQLEGKPARFSISLDSFEDLAYRSLFYRKSSDDEAQEDRVIHLVGKDGLPHPAEDMSDVIRAISNVKTRIHRLYYDESDKSVVKQIREKGILRPQQRRESRR